MVSVIELMEKHVIPKILFSVMLISSVLLSNVYAADESTSIKEFVQTMETHKGFFTFHYQPKTGKVFIQITDFGQPFLFQSSMPQGIGSNDIGLDRGQLGDTRLVKFERFGDKVLLKQLNTQYRVSSSNPAEIASIDEAFADSVIAGLSIVAEQDGNVLVDYTDFLLSDIHQISERLKATKQGNFHADAKRSGVYAPRSKAFPDNTELEALVTFAGSDPGEYVQQVTPSPTSISVHLHHSLIRLPDDQYRTRQFHPYSGFWKISYQDYSASIDESMEVSVIPRHRLVKKDPTAKISEAVEPIVYYLDPGIPQPILGALMDGAKWWDQAFRAIGYKDAFQVKILPADADPMDVRYNVIQWVHRATRGWSYGSSVIDPRTGEIIKGHVTLGSLRVRQDYLIALGLTSPFSEANTDTTAQQEMALARIRQLSAHEVGHTLGIAHNFAASEDGRESVMDYPHPDIKVEQGKVSLEGAYATGMGKWDNYVIAYGYQDLPNAKDEASYLAQVVEKAQADNLSYQSDPDARPKSAANDQGHLWDIDSNPLIGLQRLFEVREVALAQFGQNSLPEGEAYSSLQERLVPIYYLHRYQLEAVSKLLGGVSYSYEVKQSGVEPQGAIEVDDQVQNQALAAMLKTLEGKFLSLSPQLVKLITPKAYGDERTRESFKGRTGLTFDPVSAAEASAGYTLSLMLVPQRLNRIAANPVGKKDRLTISSMLEALFDQTIKRKPNKFTMAVDQRVNYVVLNGVMNAMQAQELAPEARAELLVNVSALHEYLRDNKRNEQHRAMAKQLDWFMQSGEWKGAFEVKQLPPGSPI